MILGLIFDVKKPQEGTVEATDSFRRGRSGYDPSPRIDEGTTQTQVSAGERVKSPRDFEGVNSTAKVVLGTLFKSGGLAGAKSSRDERATGFSAHEHVFSIGAIRARRWFMKRIGSLEGESNPWEYRLRFEQQCSGSMTDSSMEQSLEVGADERERINFSEWVFRSDQSLTARGPK
jgi:hypothetical protein